MSASAWVEIYRDYEADELRDAIKSLKKQLENNYSGQSVGSKSYQRDLAEMRNRLRGATRALKEMTGGSSPRLGSVNLGNHCVEDF